MTRRFLAQLFFLFVFSSQAYPLNAQTGSSDSSLWEQREWYHLLHYQRGSALRKKPWESLADDPDFFFAETGNKNPAAEFHASLEAFRKPALADNNSHPQCKFPARYYWMRKAAPELFVGAENLKCPDFQQWVSAMNPRGLTVIFPSSYINSPASMFGHTFIRVDEEGQTEKTRLLSYSISYAAETPDESMQVSFIWKGIFGGYPGFINGAAYFDKVIEYNDLESRDIWEYRLQLTQEQVDQFLRHAWEMQHIAFDYYFFLENCSYRLMSMLDVAVPGKNLSDAFSTHAIPVDTIRLLEQKQLIKEKTYRPSSLTRIQHNYQLLDKQQRREAIAIAKGKNELPEDSPWNEEDQAKMLEFSYDYLRYAVQEGRMDAATSKTRSLQILSKRSRLPETELSKVPAPESPENGHYSNRLGIQIGEQASSEFISLQWRPAFHDLLDSQIGYIPGAQIEFMSFEGRYFPEPKHTQLKHFHLVNILALSPFSVVSKPLSWSARLGWMERPYLTQHQNRFEFEGGGGFTQIIGKQLMFSLLAKTNINTRESLQSDYKIGAGLENILVFKLPKEVKFLLSASTWGYKDMNAGDGEIYKAKLNIPFLNVNNSLRLSAERSDMRYREIDSVQLAWQHYY